MTRLLLVAGSAFLLSATLTGGEATWGQSAPADPQAPAANPQAAAAGEAATDADLQPGEDPLEAERLKIWTSPEMVEARKWVIDYSRRSKQFTPQHAQRYLSQLRRMSPDQMQKWLERYAARRAERAREAAVARSAQQTAVGQSLQKLQEFEDSQANIMASRDEAALMSRQQLAAGRQFTDERLAAKQASRNATAAAMLATDYSWVYLPSLYTQWAASASLPGDLPAGDPRNSIRGDVVSTEDLARGATAGAPGAGSVVLDVNPPGDAR